MFAWFVAKDQNYTNSALPFITEYFSRQRLAKLGYRSSFSELDCETAEAFILIDSEIDRLRDAEMNKRAKRGR